MFPTATDSAGSASRSVSIMEILSVAKAQTWRQRSRQPSACAARPARPATGRSHGFSSENCDKDHRGYRAADGDARVLFSRVVPPRVSRFISDGSVRDFPRYFLFGALLGGGCDSAWGSDADRHVNLLISKAWPGSMFDADSQLPASPEYPMHIPLEPITFLHDNVIQCLRPTG